MAIRLSDGTRNGVLAYIATQLEGGVLEFRSGAQPATANAAATGTVIGTLEFAADGFADPSSGTMAKSADAWEDPAADAAGTIGWARFRRDADSNGLAPAERRIDFSVTATGGGGDIEVQNTVVALGQKITITSFSLTMPANA